MIIKAQHIHIKVLRVFLALALAAAFVPIVPKEAQAEDVPEAAAEEEALDLVEGTYAEDHVVVKFKDGVQSESTQALLQDSNTVAEESDILDIGNNWATVDVEDGKTVEDAIRELKQDPRVADVTADHYMHLTDDYEEVELAAAVNDPQASSQWHINDANAKVKEAWDIAKCDGNATVAVIDSGIDVDHPDLVNNIVGAETILKTGVDDILGHGTKVAGVIAAQSNNGIGVTGVSYNAKIMPLKVTDTTDKFYSSYVTWAINWAVSHKDEYNVKVINMSLAGSSGDTGVIDAIDAATEKGILCVCASGNNSSSTDVGFPASMLNTLAVGSIDEDHVRAKTSNGGSRLDVVAPGVHIYTTLIDGTYGDKYVSSSDGVTYWINGTSFAAPFAAAAAALCFATNPTAEPEDVKDWITSTAKDLGTTGKDAYYGWGQVVVKDAVAKAKENVTYEALYRAYNPYSGEHLYTKNWGEYFNLTTMGWKKEGIAWIAPGYSSTKVFRLYNKYTGDHHYTTDQNEYDKLGSIGWNKEGLCWYSDDSKGKAIYRLFNPYVSVGTHLYTMSKSEYDNLKKVGWKQEGIGWYGLK